MVLRRQIDSGWECPMLNRDEVANMVKAYLHKTESAVVDKIVSDIVQDADSIIRSMIRQAAYQERERLNSKGF